MDKRNRFAFFLLFCIILIIGLTAITFDGNVAVLNTKGIIAKKESDLMITATWLMLLVVVPVIIFTIVIAWRYREGNTRAKYEPDWDFHGGIEAIWWTVPFVIITILAVMTWKSSHDLDPYRSLQSEKKPLVIQVVALQWKWLFIYPEQKIATVNFCQIPKDTPIHFELTSEAPMNSFWVPQLGGQIYAMPGMKTQLYLMADEEGSYSGCSANISGFGFASMNFIVKANSQEEFQQWVQMMQKSPHALERETYDALVKPSEKVLVDAYVLKDDQLFDWSIMHYMMPMPMSGCCFKNR